MIVNKPKKDKKKISRYTMMSFVMAGLFTVIVIRMIYLQVYKHNYYEEQAKANAVRFMDEKTPRGEIIDNEGNILASNKQTYILKYTKPTEGKSNFYETMKLVFQILKDNKEVLLDDMLLKLNDKGEPYFEFKNSNAEGREFEQIRFLKDRGMNDYLRKKLYPDEEGDLEEYQVKRIDEELAKITPMEAFEYLIKSYDLIELIDSKPIKKDGKLSKEEKAEYNKAIAEYKVRSDNYKKMSGGEILNLLKKEYSLNELKEYLIVKDAIRIQGFKNYRSVTIANNIKKETAFIIYQKLNEMPGIDVDMQPVRHYPYEKLGSAVLGYVSPIDSSLKASYELRGYDASTDLIGKSGIESAYENELKGTKGGKTVKVNSEGRETEELFKLESYPGNNVHLNINKDVQYATQKSLEDTIKKVSGSTVDGKGHGFPNATRGFAMVAEVNTGKIIALASYPDFDPNLFSIPGQLTPKQVKEYFSPDLEAFGKEIVKRPGVTKSLDELFPKDKHGFREDKYDLYPKPFYNYATLGTIPPGSIFKPMTAIAGLEEGVISPSESIMAGGKFNNRPEVFGAGFAPVCWIHSDFGGSHGPINVQKALQVSCNVYFYETAYRLYAKAINENKGLGKEEAKKKALDSIAEWAWKFGLGQDPKSDANPSSGIEIEENTLGQTYNFQSNKESIINFSKFELNDYLSQGYYEGGYTFVPFDFAASLADSPELEKAKIDLKAKIQERLEVVGTGKEGLGYDKFVEHILPDVTKIMNLSPKYKANLDSYNSKGNSTTITIQARAVSKAIAQFSVSDKPGAIMSPAQQIFSSIGQGINQYTPLQLMSYITTLANGGTRYSLNLVDKVTSIDGKVLQKVDPKVLSTVKLKPSTLTAVKEGMRRANDEDGGTASAVFREFPIESAGKTGTADYNNNQREFGRSPFATYVSFAPFDKPEIAFVGAIYDGGHGSYTAPVARAAYEAYFQDVLKDKFPGYVSSSETFKKYVTDAPKDNKPGAENTENDKKNEKK